MVQIAESLWVHWRYQTIPCSLCTKTFDEHYISVIIRADERILGHLCPMCLSKSPRSLAFQIDDLASLLTERTLGISGLSTPAKATFPGWLKAFDSHRYSVHLSSPVMRAYAILSRLDMKHDRLYTPVQTRITAAAISLAHSLKVLTRSLKTMKAWHVTLTELISREALLTWLASPDRRQQEVRQTVLARYRHLLEPNADEDEKATHSLTAPATQRRPRQNQEVQSE